MSIIRLRANIFLNFRYFQHYRNVVRRIGGLDTFFKNIILFNSFGTRVIAKNINK